MASAGDVEGAVPLPIAKTPTALVPKEVWRIPTLELPSNLIFSDLVVEPMGVKSIVA